MDSNHDKVIQSTLAQPLSPSVQCSPLASVGVYFKDFFPAPTSIANFVRSASPPASDKILGACKQTMTLVTSSSSRPASPEASTPRPQNTVFLETRRSHWKTHRKPPANGYNGRLVNSEGMLFCPFLRITCAGGL